jgi:uncharacterized membrane protein YgaE (UPF0421/DUF939 family)
MIVGILYVIILTAIHCYIQVQVGGNVGKIREFVESPKYIPWHFFSVFLVCAGIFSSLLFDFISLNLQQANQSARENFLENLSISLQGRQVIIFQNGLSPISMVVAIS